MTIATAHSAAGVEEELIGGRGDATEDLVYEVGLPVTSEVAVVLGVDLGLHTRDRASEGGADRVRVVRLAVAGEGAHQLRLEHLVDVAAVEVLDGGVGAAVARERVLLMYLAPVADDLPSAPVAWPKIFAKSVIFSITASNPMGFQVPPEANLAANAALEEDIRNMQRPCTPRAWWRSFSFDAKEGLQPREQADREGASWREDVSLRC